MNDQKGFGKIEILIIVAIMTFLALTQLGGIFGTGGDIWTTLAKLWERLTH